MFEEKRWTWRKRTTQAILLFVLNIVAWVILPEFFFSLVSNIAPSNSLSMTPASMYAFGFTITGLQVLGALAEGTIASIVLRSGSYISLAYYLYSIVNGGTITLTASGIRTSFDFQPLLFLIVLPPLYNAVRTPLIYLAQEYETNESLSDLL